MGRLVYGFKPTIGLQVGLQADY